jgi:hypothetical protein
MSYVEVIQRYGEDLAPYGTRVPGSSALAGSSYSIPTGSPRPPAVRFARTGVAALVVVGTLSVPGVALAETLNSQSAERTERTVAAPIVVAPEEVDNLSASRVLIRLSGVSQLAWGEVAQALGVSRRTVHNWLSSLQIAPVHLSRLRELAKVVDAEALGDPAATHARLTARGPYGRSALEDFALRHQSVGPIAAARARVSDLVEPDMSSLRVPPSPRTSRSSSLRGGPMKLPQPEP